MNTTPRATYSVVWPGHDEIFIIDEGGPLSVANDAERVIAELVAQYGHRRIFYRDRYGMWAELVHERGRFTGYGRVQMLPTQKSPASPTRDRPG